MADKKPKIMPTVAGLYWARMDVDNWYNLIVSVEGEAPMLQIGWAVKMNGLDAPKLFKPGPWQIDEWHLEPILRPDEKPEI